MLFLVVPTIAVVAYTTATGLRCASPRSPSPRMELGLQVDPLATASSVFVLGGFTLLQLKIRYAEGERDKRDAAVETLRKAEVLLLAGRLTAEDVAKVEDAAKVAVDAYDEARQILVIPGALLRLPDPSAAKVARVMGGPSQPTAPAVADDPTADDLSGSAVGQAPPPDQLDPLRAALGLKQSDRAESEGSILPTGSNKVTLKDIAIGFALVAQVSWFFLSLTDPMGAPNPLLEAALQSGGEMVDAREARKAAQSAEYAQMLRDAVESGEAPPVCATRKLGDPLGGCAGDTSVGDAEFARTRGLDADRGWIDGPPPKAPTIESVPGL